MKVIQFDSLEGVAVPNGKAEARPVSQAAVQCRDDNDIRIAVAPGAGLLVDWGELGGKNPSRACTLVPWMNVKSAIVLLDDGERAKLFPEGVEKAATKAGK